MEIRILGLCLFLFAVTALPSIATDSTFVRFNTNLGNIDVQMLSDEAPGNVANFLSYIDSGAYTDVIINRSVPGFVIQGGGYALTGNSVNFITPRAAINGEPGVSNVRGTLAMALSAGPNTGTNQWFFNLVDNSAALDGTADGGPFTVFAQVFDAGSLTVMDAIAAEPLFDFSSTFNSDFSSLPLINFNSTAGLQIQNLVLVSSMFRVETYVMWQSLNFTANQLADPTISGPAATPNNDGVPNLLRYLCNISSSAPISVSDHANLPVTKLSGGNLLLIYHTKPVTLNVSVAVQTSTDLVNWSTPQGATITQTGTDSNGNAIMQAKVTATGGVQYIRLQLSE